MSTVFTGSGDARARAFDAQSGALQRVFRGHAFIINCVQVGAALAGRPLPPRERGPREGARVPTPQHPAAGSTSSPKPRSSGPRCPPPRRESASVVDVHAGAAAGEAWLTA